MELKPDEHDPRVFFAAERTLLAWIRTALALMGLGFVIARFDVLARGVESLVAGVTLIAASVTFTLTATKSYLTTVHRLRRGEPLEGDTSTAALFLAALLVLFGIAIAAYLIA
jgi:putative membrane protein